MTDAEKFHPQDIITFQYWIEEVLIPLYPMKQITWEENLTTYTIFVDGYQAICFGFGYNSYTGSTYHGTFRFILKELISRKYLL